jgi:hypothetical protein
MSTTNGRRLENEVAFQAAIAERERADMKLTPQDLV